MPTNKEPDFESYVEAAWPKNLPSDCTRLDAKERDCLERDVTKAQRCPSCVEYARLITEFYKESTS